MIVKNMKVVINLRLHKHDKQLQIARSSHEQS